jgi:hypothetical protein
MQPSKDSATGRQVHARRKCQGYGEVRTSDALHDRRKSVSRNTQKCRQKRADSRKGTYLSRQESRRSAPGAQNGNARRAGAALNQHHGSGARMGLGFKRGGCKRRNGLRGCQAVLRVQRAMRRRCEDVLMRSSSNHARNHCLGHGAMVRSVAPAACRQIGVIVCLEGRSQRHHADPKRQQDGKGTPHLHLMLHHLAVNQ